MIRDGVDAELDELRAIRSVPAIGLQIIRPRSQSPGPQNSKVGYNKVFGYFIELGKQYADKVPASYVRKQTLVNAERYITSELKEYEDKVLGAEERIRSRERLLFETLRQWVVEQVDSLQTCSESLAHLDVFAALAEVASRGGWCRPQMDDTGALELQQARHPVIESVLGAGRFIANDCQLNFASDADYPNLIVITGPNMAGKSTHIRQVALCVIMAQAGCFVPADSAHIGIVDRDDSIGAGDELARHMSTFMVKWQKPQRFCITPNARW